MMLKTLSKYGNRLYGFVVGVITTLSCIITGLITIVMFAGTAKK